MLNPWGRRAVRRMLTLASPGVMPPDEPPSPFTPAPPLPPEPYDRRSYLIGLLCGLLPLIVAMVGLGGAIRGPSAQNGLFSVILVAGGILYVVAIIVMIVFLALARMRRVGFGLLTSVLASPVIFFIGCIALFVAPRP